MATKNWTMIWSNGATWACSVKTGRGACLAALVLFDLESLGDAIPSVAGALAMVGFGEFSVIAIHSGGSYGQGPPGQGRAGGFSVKFPQNDLFLPSGRLLISTSTAFLS